MENRLPNNWVKDIPLGEILITKKGKKPKETITTPEKGYLPYILIHEMEGKGIRTYTNDIKVPIVNKEDILLVWDGSIGKCASGLHGAIGSTLVALTPVGKTPTRFIEFFIKYRNQYIHQTSTGTGLQHINKDFFKDCLINLPPLAEQQRIVAKLDSLFGHLDTLKKRLDFIPGLLKNFRQAILIQAFKGEITKEWRSRQANLPTADELLEQIKKEQKEHYNNQVIAWEINVEQWKRAGQGRKKPIKPKKIKEFNSLTISEQNELPITPSKWIWTKFNNICPDIRNGVSQRPNGLETDEKIFRISAVRSCNFNLEDYRFIINKEGKFDGFILNRGDLLFTRYNGTRRYVGVSAVFNSDENFLYPDKLIRTTLLTKIANPYYFEYATNSYASRSFINSRIRTSAGQSGISGTDIKNMPVPFCSIQEQNEIAKRVESLFIKADTIERKYNTLKGQIEGLPQAILAKAFKGELVEQLPTDGNAKDLLEEIKKLSAEVVTKKKKKK